MYNNVYTDSSHAFELITINFAFHTADLRRVLSDKFMIGTQFSIVQYVFGREKKTWAFVEHIS